MEIFEIGIKILLALTAIFFLVFFYLCALWSKPAHPERRFRIGAMVSVMYSFVFFLAGFILVSLISLILKYLPSFIKLFSL